MPLRRATSIAALIAMLIALFLALLLWTPDRDRASLEAAYLRAPGDMVDVAGWRLHLRDDGPKDAPAIVLLHGFGSSLHTWEAWAAPLAATYRVVRFDLPGSGLSLPDPARDYRDARSMELLLAVLDRLGIARATLVGHSMGGRIAWNFAARHPERIERLVLVAPDGFASPGFAYETKPEVPMLAGLMKHVLPKPLLRMNLAPAYADPKALSDETTTRYYELMLAPGARDAVIARLEQTWLVDPVPTLKTIAAPTFLLWGEQDRLIPVKNAADYLAALPNATLTSLPDVGHLPQEEAPERSLAALRAFLDKPVP